MKYTRPRAAIATGLCLLMAAGPVAPAAFAVDGDSAGQQRYERADVKVNTVLFDANGGSFSGGVTFVDIATQADGTVVFPENPTRDGYEFAGWTYDSAGTDPYVDGTKLDKHVNLYAQWTKQAEAATTVLFDANGGLFSTGLDLADIAMQADGTVVFPENPTREGYEFAGWTYDSAGTDPYVDGTKLDKHVNLYAQWNKVETPAQEDVTYTFEDVDGTVLGSVTYTYEQIIAGVYNWGVVAPEKAGYEFVGWCVEGTDYTVDPATTVGPQSDTTFVAKWSKVETPMQEPVTYTFVDEDGTTVLGSVTYDYAQILAGLFNWDVVKPVKEGYEFVGWCVAGTDYVIDPAFVAGPQHDTTFVAKWNKVETPVQEDVTYTFVEEDWTVLGSVTYTYDQVLNGVFDWDVVKPAKEGYKFLGWCYEGTDYVVDPSTVAGPQHNATFVAKWEKIGDPVEQNVTFTFYDEDQTTVLGDVTYTMSQIEAGVYNWNVITPAPRDGYVFEGWSFMGSEGIIDFNVTRAPSTDQSLVAHWKAVDSETVTHKVTFSDGIEATEDAVIEVEDGKAVARPGDPELAGYKFLGWTLDKETMELYDFSTPVTADITLHGVWQKVAAETPGADENQAQGENGKAENVNAESAKAELTTLPQTSDNSMMLVGVAAAAGVAALGAGAYALRRRNEQR